MFRRKKDFADASVCFHGEFVVSPKGTVENSSREKNVQKFFVDCEEANSFV